MPKVTFQIENGKPREIVCREGDTLMSVARTAGIALDAPCAGNGTCGKCRVRVVRGTVAAERTRHIGGSDWENGWRLACESRVREDVAVEVPASAAAFRTGIRTADLNDPAAYAAFEKLTAELRELGILGEARIRSVLVAMDAPTADDTMPDNERLLNAFCAVTGEEAAALSLHAVRKMAFVLRESGFAVRCVYEKRENTAEILDILPSEDTAPLCGLAVDIGTTTVTMALADMETGRLLGKASAGNGQIRYGADVINRIIQSCRENGAEKLRHAVVEETLLPLIASVCAEAGIPSERIYAVTVAGNTTMETLLLGIYADPVRMEPFIPSFFDLPPVRACDVLPGLNTAARLKLAPNVGSYVGGDITAGVLAGELWRNEELSLFIDLGTNGEIVLGNNEYMMTCACSAGPAFEGGDISCGMRATDGAVEAITIDRETMEPTVSVIGGGKVRGLCGSGIIDIVAELFRTGIINAKGKFSREGRRIRRDEHGMGRYILAFADESATGADVSINETDIDNFIRAKGAIFSAVLLMLRQLDMTPDMLGTLWIAGGIGSGINFENAVTIGMFPDIDRSAFRYIGNSSLTGAYAMLLSDGAEKKVSELAANMMYVELSNEPGYMDEFISACFLPHTDARLFPSVEV